MKIQCLTNLRDGCRSGLLLIALSLLSGCSDFGVSVGDFPTEQLLLSAAAFPVGWDDIRSTSIAWSFELQDMAMRRMTAA